MQNLNRKPIILIAVIILISACCISMLFLRDRLTISPAMQICMSLIREELLDTSEQCIQSNYPYIYMPGYFPVDQADVEYVEKGMQEFEILDAIDGEKCSDGRDLQVIHYGLRKNLLLKTYAETVDLAFCDGVLTTIRYHD